MTGTERLTRRWDQSLPEVGPHYDPLGAIGNWGYSSTTAWLCFFTAGANPPPWPLGPPTTVLHWTNVPAPLRPTAGTAITGTMALAGYHTGAPPPTAGEKFSVVMQVPRLPIQYAKANYSSKATEPPGRKFSRRRQRMGGHNKRRSALSEASHRRIARGKLSPYRELRITSQRVKITRQICWDNSGMSDSTTGFDAHLQYRRGSCRRRRIWPTGSTEYWTYVHHHHHEYHEDTATANFLANNKGVSVNSPADP